MMDVLEGNRERALKSLFTTLTLATLRIGLKGSQAIHHVIVLPHERSQDSEALTEESLLKRQQGCILPPNTAKVTVPSEHRNTPHSISRCSLLHENQTVPQCGTKAPANTLPHHSFSRLFMETQHVHWTSSLLSGMEGVRLTLRCYKIPLGSALSPPSASQPKPQNCSFSLRYPEISHPHWKLTNPLPLLVSALAHQTTVPGS